MCASHALSHTCTQPTQITAGTNNAYMHTLANCIILFIMWRVANVNANARNNRCTGAVGRLFTHCHCQTVASRTHPAPATRCNSAVKSHVDAASECERVWAALASHRNRVSPRFAPHRCTTNAKMHQLTYFAWGLRRARTTIVRAIVAGCRLSTVNQVASLIIVDFTLYVALFWSITS